MTEHFFTNIMHHPSGWVVAQIEDIALKISNGFTCKQSKIEQGIAVTRIETISAGVVDLNKVGYVNDIALDMVEKWRLQIGDILFSHINSDMHLGKSAVFALPNIELLHGMNLLNIRADQQLITPEFLNYWFNKLRFDGYFQSIAQHAVNQSSINISKLNQVPVVLPPHAEQTRIVAKIEELLSDLDAGVAELKAAQKKLGQYRQSLLKAAVEGALTAEWRAKNTPSETGAQLLQRILSERRARWEAKQRAKFAEQGKTPPKDWQKKYPEPVQPDTSDLPALPVGWEWASVEQLTEFVTSGSRGWADYYADAGATFIRSQNINKDWLDLSDIAFVNPPTGSEGARTRVQKDDVLLTITGANVGKTARVEIQLDEAYVSQHVALIRMIDSSLSEFLHLFLSADSGGRGQLNKLAYGAGKPGLNLQQVGAVSIPLPSSSEIHALLEAVSFQWGAVAANEAAIVRTLKQSTAQRQNILRAAFAGELVPQDPNDEPASVLLERIRAERAAQAGVKKPRGRQTPIQE